MAQISAREIGGRRLQRPAEPSKSSHPFRTVLVRLLNTHRLVFGFGGTIALLAAVALIQSNQSKVHNDGLFTPHARKRGPNEHADIIKGITFSYDYSRVKEFGAADSSGPLSWWERSKISVAAHQKVLARSSDVRI